jgi:lipopolysaccharide export system protein LptA
MLRRNWVMLLALCFPLLSSAMPDDSQQTVHIIADTSEFNYKTGVDIYEGNVKIDQGSTHVTADRIITQKNAQHKIVKAVAFGIKKLAEYSTIPKKDDLEFHAKGKIITFYPLKSLISLEGDVTVTQGKNSFQGPVISYNMKDQIVTAPASNIGHATIVIEPK